MFPAVLIADAALAEPDERWNVLARLNYAAIKSIRLLNEEKFSDQLFLLLIYPVLSPGMLTGSLTPAHLQTQ